MLFVLPPAWPEARSIRYLLIQNSTLDICGYVITSPYTGYKNENVTYSVQSSNLANQITGCKNDSVKAPMALVSNFDENSDKTSLEYYKNTVLDPNVNIEAKINAVISIDNFLKNESNTLILNNEEFCIELGKILHKLRKDNNSKDMSIYRIAAKLSKISPEVKTMVRRSLGLQ